jgi:hypothetical protein
MGERNECWFADESARAARSDEQICIRKELVAVVFR